MRNFKEANPFIGALPAILEPFGLTLLSWRVHQGWPNETFGLRMPWKWVSFVVCLICLVLRRPPCLVKGKVFHQGTGAPNLQQVPSSLIQEQLQRNWCTAVNDLKWTELQQVSDCWRKFVSPSHLPFAPFTDLLVVFPHQHQRFNFCTMITTKSQRVCGFRAPFISWRGSIHQPDCEHFRRKSHFFLWAGALEASSCIKSATTASGWSLWAWLNLIHVSQCRVRVLIDGLLPGSAVGYNHNLQTGHSPFYLLFPHVLQMRFSEHEVAGSP